MRFSAVSDQQVLFSHRTQLERLFSKEQENGATGNLTSKTEGYEETCWDAVRVCTGDGLLHPEAPFHRSRRRHVRS